MNYYVEIIHHQRDFILLIFLFWINIFSEFFQIFSEIVEEIQNYR